MKDKSEISYVINSDGDLPDIELLTTETVKVPEVGEVIHFNTHFDFDRISYQHPDLTEKQINALLPTEEKKVRGNFVVKDVKRYLSIRYVGEDINSGDLRLGGLNGTVNFIRKIPVQKVVETFEVFIEPTID